MAMADDDEHECEDEQQPVDQRRGQWVEVVVGCGDELADLVDEQAGSPSGQDRRQGGYPRSGHDQREQGGHDERQAAPEHVRDVQFPAADLRVSRQLQEPARPHHGDDERHDDEQKVPLRPVADPRTSACVCLVRAHHDVLPAACHGPRSAGRFGSKYHPSGNKTATGERCSPPIFSR
jgi:hypothetical protein